MQEIIKLHIKYVLSALCRSVFFKYLRFFICVVCIFWRINVVIYAADPNRLSVFGAQCKWRNGKNNRTLTLSLTLVLTLTLNLTLLLTLNLTLNDYFQHCAICSAPFALRRIQIAIQICSFVLLIWLINTCWDVSLEEETEQIDPSEQDPSEQGLEKSHSAPGSEQVLSVTEGGRILSAEKLVSEKPLSDVGSVKAESVKSVSLREESAKNLSVRTGSSKNVSAVETMMQNVSSDKIGMSL